MTVVIYAIHPIVGHAPLSGERIPVTQTAVGQVSDKVIWREMTQCRADLPSIREPDVRLGLSNAPGIRAMLILIACDNVPFPPFWYLAGMLPGYNMGAEIVCEPAERPIGGREYPL
jgi:hypothetical protein